MKYEVVRDGESIKGVSLSCKPQEAVLIKRALIMLHNWKYTALKELSWDGKEEEISLLRNMIMEMEEWN